MKKTKFRNKVCYACEVCGFAYRNKKDAEECEEWCKTHHNCSMSIVKKSINFKEHKPVYFG